MNEAEGRGAGFDWAMAAVGIVLGIGWMLASQKLGELITIRAEIPAMVAFYALLFGPLLVLGIVLGPVSRVRVLRGGDSPPLWAGIGFAMGAGGLLATTGFSWLNGGLVAADGARLGAGALALGVVITLFQVAAEEVLFRGWLQPLLVRRTGVIGGVVLSAMVFSAFHILGGARDPLSLVNLMLGGVLFGLLAWRSGGLLAPIMAHFGWNVIEDLGFGLVPNPGLGPLGAWSDHDLTGGALWGATSEGLNSSIGTTVVLLALILPLLARIRSALPEPVAA